MVPLKRRRNRPRATWWQTVMPRPEYHTTPCSLARYPARDPARGRLSHRQPRGARMRLIDLQFHCTEESGPNFTTGLSTFYVQRNYFYPPSYLVFRKYWPCNVSMYSPSHMVRRSQTLKVKIVNGCGHEKVNQSTGTLSRRSLLAPKTNNTRSFTNHTLEPD